MHSASYALKKGLPLPIFSYYIKEKKRGKPVLELRSVQKRMLPNFLYAHTSYKVVELTLTAEALYAFFFILY